METKLDNLLSKLESTFNNWLTEFDNKPVTAGIKVIVLIYIIKQIKKVL